MPQNLTTTELVRFEAAGLDDLTAATQKYADLATECEERVKKFAAAVKDGSFTKLTDEVTKAAHQSDLLQAKFRNQILTQNLNTGAFFKHAQAIAATTKEYEKLQKVARLQTAIAERGRLGGFLAANQPAVQTLQRTATGTVAAATGIGMGLVRSGLQGTVEGYRLEYAYTRLARQAAAVATPAVNALADAIGNLASRFERLTNRQQNAILYTGLAVTGIAALGFAIKGLVAVGGAVMTLGRGVGLIGAAGAAGVGGATTAAGGAAAGAAAARGGFLAMAARYLPPIAAAYSVGQGVTGGYYSDLRAKGNNRAIAGLGALGGGAIDLLTSALTLGQVDYTEYHRKRGRFGGTGTDDPAKKRDVSLLQYEARDVGETYGILQQEILKVTAAGDREKAEGLAAAKETADAVKEIRSLLLTAITPSAGRSIDSILSAVDRLR